MKRLNYFLTGLLIAGVTIGGFNINHAVGQAATQVAVKPNDFQNRPEKASIDYVVANKLMWLFPDGNFRPDQAITQADLIAGLTNVKGLSQGIAVPDLPVNHWAKVYYERAKFDGILDGVVVNPAKVLTREEASQLMTNAWKKLRTRYQTQPQYYINYGVDSQWIIGKTGKFPNGVSTTKYDALGNITRGEQAIGLYYLHRDFVGITEGEKIATSFQSSLKKSGTTLIGSVPSAKGFDVRLLIQFKDNNVATVNAGNFSYNIDNIIFAEFTVKRQGDSTSLARYNYQKFPSIERTNSRW